MSKQDSATTTLNENLLDEFSDKLETTINRVCEKHSDLDPRLELLVTLGMFCAQVGIDSGYDKNEFLALIGEMFDDSVEGTEPDKIKIDVSKLN